MGAFVIHPSLPFCQSHYQQQGPFAPRPLQPLPRYYWPVRHPLAFLPFPGVAGYRSDLLQRFLAGARRASPVCLMRPCHRAVANTPHKVVHRLSQFAACHAAFTQLRGIRPLARYFSRLLCVHCSLRPDGLLTTLKMALSINERFGFPLSLYSSYEASDFYLDGFTSH